MIKKLGVLGAGTMGAGIAFSKFGASHADYCSPVFNS
jgi:hypothetical protein